MYRLLFALASSRGEIRPKWHPVRNIADRVSSFLELDPAAVPMHGDAQIAPPAPPLFSDVHRPHHDHELSLTPPPDAVDVR